MEKVTPESVFFVITNRKFILSSVTHRGLSFYSACYPEKLVCKEAASVAAILNQCSTARPLGVTSFRPRDLVLSSVFEPYRSEPERDPNAENRESENEEVNDRLEGTFWCTCE